MAELFTTIAPPLSTFTNPTRKGDVVPALFRNSVLMAPMGALTVRLLMVSVLGVLVVTASMVTVLERGLVMKIPPWQLAGARPSDQFDGVSHLPPKKAHWFGGARATSSPIIPMPAWGNMWQ